MFWSQFSGLIMMRYHLFIQLQWFLCKFTPNPMSGVCRMTRQSVCIFYSQCKSVLQKCGHSNHYVLHSCNSYSLSVCIYSLHLITTNCSTVCLCRECMQYIMHRVSHGASSFKLKVTFPQKQLVGLGNFLKQFLRSLHMYLRALTFKVFFSSFLIQTFLLTKLVISVLVSSL